MWADNETEVDLLGFDFLVDTLFVALTEPRLLPLTVGLLGGLGLWEEQPDADLAGELRNHDGATSNTAS